MAILYIVRHGHVSLTPTDSEDPELSVAGQAQAALVADELQARLPDGLPVLTSPLLRCRQTAAPLCARWGIEPVVEPRVAEVPGPPEHALPRKEWLRRALLMDWPELIELGGSVQEGYESVLTGWRQGVLDAVLSHPHDAVIFSHFVPVNVLTGHATGSNKVACFLPDNTSVTVFETSDAGLRLIERGRALPTKVS